MMRRMNLSCFIRSFVVAFIGISRINAASSTLSPGDTVLIQADDPRINYYGRFDFSTPAKPRVNWSGAIIEAAFPGPIIGMRIDHQNAFYDVEIDGTLDTVLSVGSGQTFIFRKNLTSSMHTVRIALRSENHYGAGTFYGLYLAKGKEPGTPPVKPSRKIEFIGDSYTAGYGIESPSRSCSSDQLNKYTNANRAFGALVTRAFLAQSIILGWSGAGMVRNYGDSKKRSADPFPAYYDSTLGAVWNSGKYDFSKWKPQLVVICLGTNDYSTTPHPDDSMYIGDYHKFIARVLGNYPDASILCVSTGDATFEKNVKRVVAEETATLNHSKVYFAPYPPSLADSGCDWHPTINDNKRIAGALVDTIMKQLEWDTATSAGAVLPHAARTSESPGALSANRRGNRLLLIVAESAPPGIKLCLTDLRGKLLAREIIGPDRKCAFLTQRLCPGIYLAGSDVTGWINVVVYR